MIPQVVFDLAEVLPQFEGPDLECQLQTFDIFLALIAADERPAFVALFRDAASKTRNNASRARIEAAAQSVADGGRAAAVHHHDEAMRAYRVQHAANFPPPAAVEAPPEPPEPPKRGGVRKVDEREYATAIRTANAVKDMTLPQRNMGIVERWIDPEGYMVAWMAIQYFKGEEDYEYWVSSRLFGTP
jgi:hypothetical protein